MKQTLPTSVVPADMQRIREQMQDYITDAAALPISFICGGERIKGLPARFSPRVKEERKGDVIERTFTGKDETGLEITVVTTEYTDFPVAEIVAYFRGGAQNTPVLRDILAFDGKFRGRRPVLYHNTGDYYSSNGYETRSELMEPNFQTHMNFAPTGGRACDEAFPYFKLQCEGFGLNIAVGWPAQWKANFRSIQGGVAMQAGQEITHLYIRPGETIRTPRITIMAYEGDYARGINLWRRWYFKHILPRPNGKPIPKIMHASYNGGGPEFTESTEQNQLEYIQKYVDSGLPYNCWWIDAGWYDCTLPDGTKFWPLTGNWYADKKRYPIGLRPISNKLHQHGMSFLLWFEPERAMRETDWVEEHMDYMLYGPGAAFYLYDLSNDEAADYLIEYMDGKIKEYGMTWYRQDFNCEPYTRWINNDEENRKGMTEIKYITNLYRFLNTLRERNPGLMIDNCAAGGRRLDLETMSRSAPLWRTDYRYGEVNGYQCHTYGLNFFLPLHGTGIYGTDDYNFRSSLSSAMVINWEITSIRGSIPDMQRVIAEYKELRPYFYEDYYPLTGLGDLTGDDVWLAYQLNKPSDGTGIVVAFRRKDNPQDSTVVKLRGLDPQQVYSVQNGNDGKIAEKTGKELADGLTLEIGEAPGSLLLKYGPAEK